MTKVNTNKTFSCYSHNGKHCLAETDKHNINVHELIWLVCESPDCTLAGHTRFRFLQLKYEIYESWFSCNSREWTFIGCCQHVLLANLLKTTLCKIVVMMRAWENRLSHWLRYRSSFRTLCCRKSSLCTTSRKDSLNFISSQGPPQRVGGQKGLVIIWSTWKRSVRWRTCACFTIWRCSCLHLSSWCIRSRSQQILMWNSIYCTLLLCSRYFH